MKVTVNGNYDFVMEFDYEERIVLCKAGRIVDMDLPSVIHQAFEENLRTMRRFVEAGDLEGCGSITPWCGGKAGGHCVGCSCVLAVVGVSSEG